MRELTPTGSAATSSMRGCIGAVGTTSASTPSSAPIATARSRSTSRRSRTSRCAGISRAALMMRRTVGSTRGVRMRVDEFAYGGVSFAAPTRRRRSSLAAARNGAMSTRDGACARVGQPADGGVERGAPLPVQPRAARWAPQRRDGRRREPDVGRPVDGLSRRRPSRPSRGSPARGSGAKIVTQSQDSHAGTTPSVLMTPGGFDPDDALQARGHASRAGRVGADRDVGLAGGDRDRRSRAGSAADEFGPAAVGHRAVRRAGADEAGRELVEVGLADDDRARLPAAPPRPPRRARVGTRTPGRPRWWAARRRRRCPSPRVGPRPARPGSASSSARNLGLGSATDPHGHADQPRGWLIHSARFIHRQRGCGGRTGTRCRRRRGEWRCHRRAGACTEPVEADEMEGSTMFETPITVVGNIVTDPHRRMGRRPGARSSSGWPAIRRRRTADGNWEPGNSLFVTVNCWGKLVTGRRARRWARATR